MFARILLLNGAPRPLTYAVPPGLQALCKPGALVRVPLQHRHEWAFVQACFTRNPEEGLYTVRHIENVVRTADHPHTRLIQKLAAYHGVSAQRLYKRLRTFLGLKTQVTETSASSFIYKLPTLTAEQARAAELIHEAYRANDPTPLLIHGVTGSGKTEVYIHALQRVLADNGCAVVLVPEVTVALALHTRLTHALGTDQVHGFHSASSAAAKRDAWRAVSEHKPCVIIGVHMPLLLPFERLSLIIVDEEHELGFQEKQHPHINAKEAALLAASLYRCPIALGSATPSVTSMYQVRAGAWRICTLSTRFQGAFPRITTVCLRNKARQRSCFWLSSELEEAIEQALAKGEQSLIFLNRRGYSFFVQCASCASIPQCSRCSVSLTLHEDNSLRCHYCSYHCTMPTHCSGCSHDTFIKKGLGTQQVVQLIAQRFPKARIARADHDSTVNKKRWQETCAAFTRGDIDILIGTQTITKGLHFPRVTVVGIIWADCNLHLPVYHACETTVQQLIQVAGRAGRERADSHVIVQYIKEHPALGYLTETEYPTFCVEELSMRAQMNYPPFVRFAELVFAHECEAQVEADAQHAASRISDRFAHTGMMVLGPTAPLIAKREHIYYRTIYLKASSYHDTHAAYMHVMDHEYASHPLYTPNPV